MGISYPILSQSQYPHTAHTHTHTYAHTHIRTHAHTWQMNNQINLVIFVIIALRTTWKNQFVYYLNNLSMFLFVWASITLNGFGLDLQLFASICTRKSPRQLFDTEQSLFGRYTSHSCLSMLLYGQRILLSLSLEKSSVSSANCLCPKKTFSAEQFVLHILEGLISLRF